MVVFVGKITIQDPLSGELEMSDSNCGRSVRIYAINGFYIHFLQDGAFVGGFRSGDEQEIIRVKHDFLINGTLPVEN